MPGAAGEARGGPGARRGRPRVGVLSLQGDFARHNAALAALGCEAVRVSLPAHLDRLDALILPGGESTTMLRLLDATGLRAPVARWVRRRPALGTCAGLILLAARADRLPRPPLAALDVDAARNAYGRQIHSFTGDVELLPLRARVAGVFIRAPRLTRVGPGVQVIARRGGEPVGVRRGRVVAVAFHPELTSDLRLHRWFLHDVAGLELTPAPIAPFEPATTRVDSAAARPERVVASRPEPGWRRPSASVSKGRPRRPARSVTRSGRAAAESTRAQGSHAPQSPRRAQGSHAPQSPRRAQGSHAPQSPRRAQGSHAPARPAR